jgi:hypothetical protein
VAFRLKKIFEKDLNETPEKLIDLLERLRRVEERRYTRTKIKEAPESITSRYFPNLTVSQNRALSFVQKCLAKAESI